MLKRNSSVSMYEQIVDMLKEEIFQKKVAADGCLGTHKDLAEKYRVSLITIRKALQVLEEQGIVEIKQGKGTFVSRNILANKYNFFSGFVDVLYGEINNEHNQRLIAAEIIETPKRLPSHILPQLGDRCYMSEKVFLIKGNPVGQYVSYVPLKYGAFIELSEISSKTTYELFVEKFNVELGKGFQRIRAVSADLPQTEKLNIAFGAPLIFIQRETHSRNGEFLELMEIFSEYSQYEYIASLALDR